MIKKFLDMPNDSKQKTIAVALILCLVCSVAVSAAAVALKPVQDQNKLYDKQRNVLEIAGLMEPDKSVSELFNQIQAKVVDLKTGEYAPLDPANFDARAAAIDPDLNVVLNKEEDIASIKRRAQFATVYIVNDAQGRLQKIILPVYGYGLWSTLYGFIALESDLNTVVGLGFYEHAETPGLGGEVDNPQWKAKWIGKKVYDETGQVALHVVKGAATEGEAAQYQVDALSGATLTSRGVDNIIHYWLGENGFRPYLDRLRQGGEV